MRKKARAERISGISRVRRLWRRGQCRRTGVMSTRARLQAVGEGGPWRVWRVAVNGGSPRVFGDTEASVMIACAPSTASFYQRPGNQNFHILDPATESEQPLVEDESVGFMFYPRISPDGSRVAVFWNRRERDWSIENENPRVAGLWIIPLDGSPADRGAASSQPMVSRQR